MQDNLTIILQFDQSPSEVFSAINQVDKWWSESIEGNTKKVGDVFLYRHKDMHRSTQTVTEMIPDQRVVWAVSDSNLSFLKHTAEWDGTSIVFDISKDNGKTKLVFTHVGLTDESECIDMCRKGWGQYVGDSLAQLIRTGEGRPDRK